jgi:crotonobetainyl-CoA:carnitine CoA-transferase CaiB-like acyl-CoA transferase
MTDVKFDLVSTPVQFDEVPSPTRRAPEFNEHGDEILGEVGYDQEETLDLRIQGSVI